MGEGRFDWSNYLECAAESDIGMRRSNNQDSFAMVMASSESNWRERGHFFIVADGMGAHAAGELASKMAVDGVPHRFAKSNEASAPEALLQAIVDTNAEIFRRGHENNEFLNMGTTASMMTILPQGALIAHVGDSRVYRLRGAQLEQMTFDHSLVWELRAAGQLGENSDLASVVPKNVITRSLGPYANVQIDLEGPMATSTGDVYMLCSDGLTGRLEDDEIAMVLSNYRPAEAAKLLVNMANLRGGHDNITVIVVKIVGNVGGDESTNVEPIRIGRRDPQNGLVQVVNVATLVFGLMTLVFLITGDWLFTSISILAGASSLGWLAWHRKQLAKTGVSLGDERKLGKAPYVTVECPTKSKFMGSITQLTDEMRHFAEESNWVSTWSGLNFANIVDLVKAGSDESLSVFSKLLSDMMVEVRRQQKRKVGNSSYYGF